MRVYQIADEVQLSNRVLVQMLQDRGVEISSHMVALTDQEEIILREVIEEIRPAPVEMQPEPVSPAPV